LNYKFFNNNIYCCSGVPVEKISGTAGKGRDKFVKVCKMIRRYDVVFKKDAATIFGDSPTIALTDPNRSGNNKQKRFFI